MRREIRCFYWGDRLKVAQRPKIGRKHQARYNRCKKQQSVPVDVDQQSDSAIALMNGLHGLNPCLVLVLCPNPIDRIGREWGKDMTDLRQSPQAHVVQDMPTGKTDRWSGQRSSSQAQSRGQWSSTPEPRHHAVGALQLLHRHKTPDAPHPASGSGTGSTCQ